MEARDGDDPEDCEETESLLVKDRDSESMKARHAEEKLANEASLRWLALLFFETLFLLVVQIVLGIVGGSLALLADSAHSAVDVVTYGFNYWIERTKGRSSEYASICGLQVKPWKVDAGGSMISLAALLSATTYVVVKALHLLGVKNDHDDVLETRAQYQLRGSVLFYFAALSTFGNVLVLVMYQRWHPQHGSLAKSRRMEREIRMEREMKLVAGDNDDSGASELSTSVGSCGECEPEESDNGSPSSSSGRRSRGFTFKKFKLPPRCGDVNCNPATCEQEKVNGHAPDQGEGDTPMCNVCDDDETPSQPNSQLESGNMSLLHTLVHPGCQAGCDHHIDERSGRGEQCSNNLNVTSAMLHLISDILRGITIFIVAILIEMRVVQNSIKADTVCALLVAGFILIGALALFQKVFSVVCLGAGSRES